MATDRKTTRKEHEPLIPLQGHKKELKRYTVPSIVLCRKTVWFAFETNSTAQKSCNCTPSGWQNVQWIKRQAYQLITQISWSATLAKRRIATGDHPILIVCQNVRDPHDQTLCYIHRRHLANILRYFGQQSEHNYFYQRKQLCFYKDSLHISATKTTLRRSCYKGSQT